MNRATIKGRELLGCYPSAYISLLRCKALLFRNDFYHSIVNPSTDIVIEGFPRSANSYAVEAFSRMQRQPVNIATHVHSAAHVVQSVRMGIPTLVLIRKPSSAVPSFKALMVEYNPHKKNKILQDSPDYLIRYYISFYTRLLPIKTNFVTASFEEVTSSFGKVIERINAQYQTSFLATDPDERFNQAIFSSSGKHLAPSTEREKIKKLIHRQFSESQNKALLQEAEEVYKRFILTDA